MADINLPNLPVLYTGAEPQKTPVTRPAVKPFDWSWLDPIKKIVEANWSAAATRAAAARPPSAGAPSLDFEPPTISYGGKTYSVPGFVSPSTPTTPAKSTASATPVAPASFATPAAPKVEATTTEVKAKPVSFAPPEIPKTVVPIDYSANKFYFRPNENVKDYLARTQGTATPAGSADGTISTQDQQALNAAISKADATDPASVMSSALDFFGGGTTMDTQIQSLLTDLLTPSNSFVNQYNQLIAQSGLTEDQTQLVNLQNIMNGTEDDIRSEISNAGGFATESQIQEMVYQRNKNLEKQYNSLANIANLKQGLAETQIGLIEKDQQYKETMFNTLSKLEEFGITKQTQFQNNTFNRLKWLASTGGLKGITQEEANLYSMGTGGQLSPDEIMSAGQNTSDLKDLQIAIDELRLEGINTKSSVTGATFSTALNQQTSRALSGFYGTSGSQRETIINLLQSEFPSMTPDQVQKAVYAQLPDGWDKNIRGRTAAQLKSDETQNILSDIAGGAQLPQLIAAYPDVDPATLSSMFTANLTYGTAGTP